MTLVLVAIWVSVSVIALAWMLAYGKRYVKSIPVYALVLLLTFGSYVGGLWKLSDLTPARHGTSIGHVIKTRPGCSPAP